MDHADWVNATGSVYAGGRGGYRRPANPKLVAQLLSKTAPTRSRSRSSGSCGAAHRRLMLSIYRATASTTPSVPAAYRTKAGRRAAYQRALRGMSDPDYNPSILEQSALGAAGLAAIDQHTMAVKRARARITRPIPEPPRWGMNYWP